MTCEALDACRLYPYLFHGACVLSYGDVVAYLEGFVEVYGEGGEYV